VHSAERNDSPEKNAERMHLNDVAQKVVDYTTHLRGKDHFLEIVRGKQISELDPSNDCMRKNHQFIPGGIEALVAIQNVGANPGYDRSAEIIERVMLPRILTAIAIMVIHPLSVLDCTVL